MFGKKNGISDSIPSVDKISIIADGAIFRGDLETDGNVRIDGKVIGNISSSANVAVGKSGQVDGNINAGMLKVSGKIKGNVDISTKLILDVTSSVLGDIKTSVLTVEEGAAINGKVTIEARGSQLSTGVGAEPVAELQDVR
ncbi:MAG: polymer-forming cytoskeletal protein [Rhizobacter sp.]|nr:polymer-forming cytoskeletal protein [Chlorobiales bacterium]